LSQLHAAATRAQAWTAWLRQPGNAVAGMPVDDRFKVVTERAPNIGIVTAYNDMLSAHTPMQRYRPHQDEARKAGTAIRWRAACQPYATGVTQGTEGWSSVCSAAMIAMASHGGGAVA
jgi:phosphogluconate dehydratase